jgi:hypothetical protein
VEYRISELEHKIEIKEKNRRNLSQTMQELSDSIKRPNLRIMGIEEEEEIQSKGIHNIFNKIMTENLLNLKKVLSIQVQKPPGHQTDLTKIKPPHDILSLKQQAKKEYQRL